MKENAELKLNQTVGRHENASDVNASRNARVKPRKRTKPSNQLRCAFEYGFRRPMTLGMFAWLDPATNSIPQNVSQ
jgi:hypothetical protein